MATAPRTDAKGLSDLTEAELVRTVLERDWPLQEVRFVLFSEPMLRTFEAALRDLAP